MKPSRISKIYGKAKYIVYSFAGTIALRDSGGDRIIYEKTHTQHIDCDQPC